MPHSQKSSILTTGVSANGLATKPPVGPQGPNHERVISTLNLAIQTIHHVNNVIPLQGKAVLASIAGILETVKIAFANQDDFKEIAEQCQMIGLAVWRSTFQIPKQRPDDIVSRALTDLKSSIDGIQVEVKTKAKKNRWSRVFHAAVNQETILKWRNELNRLLIVFNMEFNIANNLKLDKLLAEFQEFRISGTTGDRAHIPEVGILPVRPRIFVGRDNLVQITTQSLLELHHVALIGPGGIGKSTIARAVLNDERIVSRFQGRRFFARFDDMDASQVNLGIFLDQIARAMGSGISVNAHSSISQTLSSSDALLVLDNAETFLDAPVDAGRIAEVIDGLGAMHNVAILMTTRTTVLPPNLDWVRLRVPVLEESAACEAFKAYYPCIEISILSKLLAAVDFHPLSINLLAQAATQNEWSLQDLITAWNRQRAALLEAGDGKVHSLAITLETSLNSPSFIRLGETVHYLLQIIAFLPQGISKTRLTSIIPEAADIDTCADALCKQSLAYLNGDFITLLAPIRLYITSRYNGNISINPFYGQVRSHYAAHVQDVKIVVQDNVNIEHIFTHWLKAPEVNADVLFSAAEFVSTLAMYCCRAVSLHPVISALDTSKSSCSILSTTFDMGIPTFQISEFSHAKLHCLIAISHLECLTGQVEEAELTVTEAQDLIPRSKDKYLFAVREYSLATIYYKHGNYLAAEDMLEKALKKVSWVSAMFVHGIRCWRRLAKIALVRLYMIKGMPDSLKAYFDALPVLRQGWYRRQIGSIHVTAGFTELYHNHLDIAKNCFKEMLASMDEDEPDWLMGSLGLAEVADRQHDYAGSRALRSHLLEVVQRVPDQTTEYVNELAALLAGYLAMEGHVEQARKVIRPVLENARSYLSLNNIKCQYLAGIIELADKDLDAAERYFCKVIEVCSFSAELLYYARSHRALGEIAMVRQDMVRARNHFEVTTELCKTMGLPKERLYFDYTCCIPNKKYDGWNLYQEGHTMFQVRC